jgi:hypothetical protein
VAKRQQVGGEGQLGPEALVEGPELGDHPHDEDGHEADHHRQEDERVHGRRDRLLLQRQVEAEMAGEAAQDLVEVARPLPRHEARGEDRWVELALLPESVGEGRARLDLLAHVGERVPEQRVPLPLQHHVQGLEEGQAGLEERGELLGEDEEERRVHATLPEPEHGERQPAAHREQVEPLLLQVRAECTLVGRRDRALDDLARRCADPADVLHRRPRL